MYAGKLEGTKLYRKAFCDYLARSWHTVKNVHIWYDYSSMNLILLHYYSVAKGKGNDKERGEFNRIKESQETYEMHWLVPLESVTFWSQHCQGRRIKDTWLIIIR